MTLRYIEEKLKERRLMYYSSFKMKMAGTRELQTPIIDNIENGNNYRFSSLLKYIDALEMNLYINNEHINNAKDFGKCIKEYRISNKLTQFQVMMLCKFNISKITRIEKGQCSRCTLSTFLSVFPDFKIEIRE